MKKILAVIVLALLIAVIYQNFGSTLSSREFVISEKEISFGSQSRKIYLVAKEYEENNDQIKGELYITLFNGKKILDEKKLSFYHEITVNKSDNMICQDIDKNGTIEVFTPFVNEYDDLNTNYFMFSVDENSISTVTFNEYEAIKSSEKSIDEFTILENGIFYTYERNLDLGRDVYEYKKYKLEGKEVINFNTYTVEMSPKNLDYNSIESFINEIEKLDYRINKENLILKDLEKYEYMEENIEKIGLYLFLYDDVIDSYEFYNTFDSIENTFNQLKDIGINDIQSIKYDEFMEITSENFDIEKNILNFKDKKFVYGGFHLDSYIIMFDEDGTYLDIIIWTDKSRNNVNLFEVEGKLFVEPVIQRDMFYHCNKLNEVSVLNGKMYFSNEIIRKLELAPPPDLGYISNIELTDFDIIKRQYGYKFRINVYDKEFVLHKKLDEGLFINSSQDWEYISKIYDEVLNPVIKELVEDNRLKLIDLINGKNFDSADDLLNLLIIVEMTTDDVELKNILISKLKNIELEDYEKKILEDIIKGEM